MKLYTIGYGNDPPQEFLKRLDEAQVDYLIDVRREGCKSWCNLYEYYTMGEWIFNTDSGLIMLGYPDLANKFDILSEYQAYLNTTKGMVAIREMLDDVYGTLYASKPALMCAEKDAFTRNAGGVRCHRVYIAWRAKELEPEIQITHL